MIYGSVCSGVEAATVAWHSLGWKPSFFSEIEKFPRTVLAHHYPDVPLHGDFTTIKDGDYEPIDLLVGGTPCQDFSVAGLRKGLNGDRGNLTLEFIRLAERLKPRWILWENVPGVLSIDGGKAFGAFLGGLAELGYGFAYRILDAQYFGVPQRRRRVFVVGYLGDWRPAAAVLFERESLCGDITPRREAGEDVAGAIARCSFSGGAGGRPEVAAAGHFIAAGGGQAAKCLTGKMQRLDAETETLIPFQGGFFDSDVTHSLRGEGYDASEDGTGRGAPLIPISYGIDEEQNAHENLMGCLKAREKGGGFEGAVAFDMRGREGGAQFEGPHDTANIRAASGGSSRSYVADMQVRRLTPIECERLQGFPDNYTKISDKTADGPRYKAMGNSMAVPVMAWLSERINKIEGMLSP